MKFYTILILLIYIFALNLNSQNINQKFSSYEGLSFYVGFMDNEINSNSDNYSLEHVVFISSKQKARVHFRTFSLDQFVDLLPFEVKAVHIIGPYENFYSESIEKKLIKIDSDVPIVIYAFSSIPRSTDSYTVIPIANWGTEYKIVSLPNDQYNKVTLDSARDFTPRLSEFMIMSAYDNTEVMITTTSRTYMNKSPDSTFRVTLNAGECYLVKSYPYPRGNGDLSGSSIVSNKPVGVVSGHVRTALLQGYIEQPPDSKDHIIEMLPPTKSWGKEFCSTPFFTSPNGDYFKIIAKDSNTVVTVTHDKGVDQFKVDNKTFTHVYYPLNSPAYWQSTSPILLTQFMLRTDDSLETVYYDPSMVVLPPVEQYVSNIAYQAPIETFYVIDNSKFVAHYINLVIDSIALNNLTVDSILLNRFGVLNKQIIPGTNKYWARFEINSKTQVINTTEGYFSGILYGIGRFDSYAMSLGSSLLNPNIDDTIAPQISYNDSCNCITGRVFDALDSVSSGIYYVEINNATYNYNVNLTPYSPDLTNIYFSACPKNINQDAYFEIQYFDKKGNSNTFNYFYNGRNLDYMKEIDLGTISYKDSICIPYTITNNGKSPIRIEKISLSGDNRINIYNQYSLPMNLEPGASISILICIDGDYEPVPILGDLVLDFGCNTIEHIPIKSNVFMIDFETVSHDFGDIMIGDTVCDFIKVINKSNISITFNSVIAINPLIEFFIDSIGLFPIILQPNDTLLLPICYNPVARDSSTIEFVFRNEYNLFITAFAKGKGIAPSIPSIEIDWGNRRIGTTNDTLAYFTNNGNTVGYLDFINFISQSHTDSNSDTLQKMKNFEILPNTPIEFKFTYIPNSVGQYLIESQFKTNWKLHQDVLVVLKGNGTLPIINTVDIHFPEIEIFTTTDSVCYIIKNTGNEDLFIESITPSSGDISSFVIDYSILKDIIIKPNTEYSINIKFNPKKVGYHEMFLSIKHDANPNYRISENFVKISGDATIPNDLDVDLKVLSEPKYTCQIDTALVVIKNNNNFVVELKELIITKTSNIAEARVLDFVSTTFDAYEEKTFKILIYTEKNQGGNINIVANFFGNSTKEISFDYYPKIQQLSVSLLDELKYNSGDTVVLTLKGSYPNYTDVKAPFYLKIEMKNEYLYLINYPNQIKFNTGSSTINYPIKVNRGKDFIEFISDTILEITSNSNWELDLNFVGVLSSKLDSNWNVTFSFDDCFIDTTHNFRTKLNEICMYNLRHIQQITNVFMANIYPNPVKNQINLKVIMPEENTIEISCFDEKSRKIIENKLFSLKKGIHFVILDFDNVPNGNYFLKVRNKDKINNLKFVKIN